jgi:hypothetical protein
MCRTLGRSAFWLGLFIWLVAATTAANADVTYDYTGNVLTPTAGDFPAGQSITGNIVVSSALPPSSLDATPAIDSFSFTDGVDTISNTNGGNVDLSATGFTTNSLGQITSGGILVFGNNTAPGSLLAEIHITPFGDGILSDQLSANGSVIVSEANNSTPGMWTSPPPSLYLTFSLSGPSLSGDPTQIFASLKLATTQPPDSVLVPLPKTLSSNDATLQAAANDLGYIGFDWLQTLSGPSPLPLYECQDPTCDPTMTTEIVGSTNDPPSPYGYDYCNPASQNYIMDSVSGNTSSFVKPTTCAGQSYYYDTATAEEPSLSNGACVAGHTDTMTDTFVCDHYLTENNDTTLNFFDSPADACLVNVVSDTQTMPPLVAGGPSLAYQNNPAIKPGGPKLDDLCKNRQTTGELTFDTELIGITATGEQPIDSFTWTDDFNGFGLVMPPINGTGGVFLIAPDTDLEADPTSGTGGIVITIGGQPVSAVPEPSTIILLFSFLMPLVMFKAWCVK